MSKSLAIHILAAGSVAFFAAGGARAGADFEKSSDKLFVSWLDLAVNPDPLTEYGAYAIAQTGGENLPVIYPIFSSFKGKVSVLGAFRCDNEFVVLETASNGHYDIRCVSSDVFGRKQAKTLRYNGHGRYEE